MHKLKRIQSVCAEISVTSESLYGVCPYPHRLSVKSAITADLAAWQLGAERPLTGVSGSVANLRATKRIRSCCRPPSSRRLVFARLIAANSRASERAIDFNFREINCCTQRT